MKQLVVTIDYDNKIKVLTIKNVIDYKVEEGLTERIIDITYIDEKGEKIGVVLINPIKVEEVENNENNKEN